MLQQIKVAIPATGTGVKDKVDIRFGRAKYLQIIDLNTLKYDIIENDTTKQHGAGISFATEVVNSGAKILIAGNVGPKAFEVLKAAGITMFLGVEGVIFDVLNQHREGELVQSKKANCEGHLSLVGDNTERLLKKGYNPLPNHQRPETPLPPPLTEKKAEQRDIQDEIVKILKSLGERRKKERWALEVMFTMVSKSCKFRFDKSKCSINFNSGRGYPLVTPGQCCMDNCPIIKE